MPDEPFTATDLAETLVAEARAVKEILPAPEALNAFVSEAEAGRLDAARIAAFFHVSRAVMDILRDHAITSMMLSRYLCDLGVRIEATLPAPIPPTPSADPETAP